MISSRLWKALRHTSYNRPLFLRTLRTQFSPLAPIPPLQNPNYSYLLVAIVVLLTLAVGPSILVSLLLLVFFVPSLMILGVIAIPVLLPFASVVLSAWWAAAISGTIAVEHERRTYDLLCLFPEGSLGANWTIACACIQRGAVFEVLNFLARVMFIVAGGFVGLIMVVALSTLFDRSASGNVDNLSVVRMLMEFLLLLAAYYVHHVQTMAFGPVIGMLLPTATHSRSEAQLGALGLSLVVQVGSYVALALAWVAGRALLHHLSDTPGEPFAMLPGYLLVFYGAREAIIGYLWRTVLRRLNIADAEQVAFFLSPP